MHRIALLEREELLAPLGDQLRAAGSGAGSLALIAGEAGAGKTSLIRALIDRVGRDVLVLEGGCDPLSTPRPLGPLHGMAAESETGLGRLFAGDLEPIEIFGVVLDRLRTTVRPILLVVEDVHWADEATLDFLRFVGRRVASTKALVVCTYRDDEVGPEHPLRQMLGQLTPLPSTHRLVIPPLSVAAVSTLVDERPIDADELHRLTGGNAFYVTEVIAAGDALPRTVQDAVLARVGRLAAPARRVVEAVSIAPRSLEIERARVLADAELHDVDEAVAAGVIFGDGAALRFRHELAREAVEGSLLPARRLGLHRRMLAMLEEGGSPDLARLAHHAIRAEDADVVTAYAPEAAREASRRGAHKEAVAFYEAALAHADLLGADRAAELRIELSAELGVVDRHLDALQAAGLAADHFRRADRPMDLARALYRHADALWRTQDIPGARASTDEAIRLLRALGPSPDLGRSLYLSAHFHMLARHRAAALADVEEAHALAEETASEEVRWRAKMLLGTIEIVVGDPHRGSAILREAANEAGAVGDSRGVSVALGMLGSGGGEARLYEEAITALDECIEHGIAADEDYTVAYSRSWHARIAFEQGRWDDAARYAELVDRTTQFRTGIAVVTALGALGRVRVRRGDPGGRALLSEVLEVQHLHEIQHVWSPMAGLAEHFWLSGRPEEMEAVLADGYRRALDTDSGWARGELGFWMWRAGLIDQPPEGAARPFALQMVGDWKAAAEAWQEIGCPYEVGLALADGDEGAVLEAVAIFDGLGARPAAGMARSRLRDMGADRIPRGPTATTKANPAGLTARQLEILGLMTGGLTNAEIAERLFLSKKTVEHHVSAVYAKLGVTTRSKAMAIGARIGPPTE